VLRPSTAVWLFRQAGRHLPEYMEYKARPGRDIARHVVDMHFEPSFLE